MYQASCQNSPRIVSDSACQTFDSSDEQKSDKPSTGVNVSQSKPFTPGFLLPSKRPSCGIMSENVRLNSNVKNNSSDASKVTSTTIHAFRGKSSNVADVVSDAALQTFDSVDKRSSAKSPTKDDMSQPKPFAPGFLLPKNKSSRGAVSNDTPSNISVKLDLSGARSTQAPNAHSPTASKECKTDDIDCANFDSTRDRDEISRDDKSRSSLIDTKENRLSNDKQLNSKHDDVDTNDLITVLNDMYSKIRPDIVDKSCKTTKQFVHLPISQTSYLYDAICSAAMEYPISHYNGYTGSESLPTCITSYIVTTDPSYDRHASVKLYTDFSLVIERLVDKMHIFHISHIHNCSINNNLRKLAKRYGNMVVHLDDNFTNRFKRPPERYFASKLIPRNVNRQLQLHSTFVENDNMTHDYNSTVYNCQQLLLTGLANPRYDVDGYAYKILSKSEINVDIRPFALCDLSHVADVDLDVDFRRKSTNPLLELFESNTNKFV
jgi:hypothetical protein